MLKPRLKKKRRPRLQPKLRSRLTLKLRQKPTPTPQPQPPLPLPPLRRQPVVMTPTLVRPTLAAQILVALLLAPLQTPPPLELPPQAPLLQPPRELRFWSCLSENKALTLLMAILPECLLREWPLQQHRLLPEVLLLPEELPLLPEVLLRRLRLPAVLGALSHWPSWLWRSSWMEHAVRKLDSRWP